MGEGQPDGQGQQGRRQDRQWTTSASGERCDQTGRGQHDDAVLALGGPGPQLLVEELHGIGLDGYDLPDLTAAFACSRKTADLCNR